MPQFENCDMGFAAPKHKTPILSNTAHFDFLISCSPLADTTIDRPFGGVHVLMGTLTDFCLAAFLLFQTWLGWRSGLLRQATGLAALGFGVVLGVTLAPSLGGRILGWLTVDPFHARVLAFLFVFGLVCLTLQLLASWAEIQADAGIEKKDREQRRSQDRILGGIFGSLKALVVSLVLVAAGVNLYPKNEAWQGSRLAPPFAEAGARLLPEGAAEGVQAWILASAGQLSQKLGFQVSAPRENSKKPLSTVDRSKR